MASPRQLGTGRVQRASPVPDPHIHVDTLAARAVWGRMALVSEPLETKAVDAPETEERRRHPRAPVDLQVGLKFDSVQQFLAAYAEDISESGMLLRGDHAAAVREIGQELELRFDAGNRRIVQGRARVVRVDSGDAASTPGIGIEFVELDETSRKLVEAIVRIKLAAVRDG